MNMRMTVIGASDEAIHTIECAKRLGIETVALDGNPEAAGLEAADIPIVVDITDEKATAEIVAELGTDWIQTVPIGRYLTTTGAVNDELGLPGITRDMAVLCTDKYAFHKALSEAGLRNCHCALVRGGAIESECSYPVILKPRYGSGSRGIKIANNESELASILTDMEDVDEDYILEEFLDGDEYGIDGAVTEGKFHLILVRYKINTPMPDRQAVAYMSISTDSEIYDKIRDYMSRVVNVMELDECLMHADILDSDRGIFAIEVSARPSGHNLHNLFTPLCTGVDMAEEYIKYRMGETYSFEPKQTENMMIRYFDMEGEIRSVPKESQVQQTVKDHGAKLVDWRCNIMPGDVLEPVTTGHSLMYRGYYITKLGDRTDPDALHKDILNGF